MTAETTEWRCPDTGRLCTPEDCDRVCFQAPAEGDAALQGMIDAWRASANDSESQGYRLEAQAMRTCAADLAHHLRHRPFNVQPKGKAALHPVARRRVLDAIRGAYDLGYNDARNARAVPGDSAPGYKGRDVEADHGGALIHALEALQAPAPAHPGGAAGALAEAFGEKALRADTYDPEIPVVSLALAQYLITKHCHGQAPAVAHATGRWTVISPDGKVFTGESAHRAANEANKHLRATDPVEAKKWADMLDRLRAENEAENERLLAEHGTLDCPACGGSGHIGDVDAPGMALVPTEPTEQMLLAGGWGIDSVSGRSMWRDMLAAAKAQPPVQGGES